MAHEVEVTESQKKDFAWSWVKSSRFLFYIQVLSVVAFLIGGSWGLYKHRYKGKPKVIVPENTLYTPRYK